MMSSATRVFVKSEVSFSFWRRSFSNSSWSTDFFTRCVDVLGSVGSPVRRPASRALAHSIMWEEYRPSRRRTAPFSPFGAFSYSVTIASLYSGVNARRDGRGAGSACCSPGERWDCLSDGVDTVIRISDPTLGQEPTLTQGVSSQSDQEGTAPDRLDQPAHRAATTSPVDTTRLNWT
jgi:hypothetical protein